MDDNYIIHYGTPRHSGRYPYGSGERPFQDKKLNKIKIKDWSEAAKIISENRYQSQQVDIGDIENVKKNAIQKISKEPTYFGDRTDKKSYSDLQHDRIISKGSVAYRSIPVDSEDYKKGPTYVSFDAYSANLYAGQDGIGGKTYKYILSKDIKLPSIKKMSIVMLDQMMKNNETYNLSINEYLRRKERDIAAQAHRYYKRGTYKNVKTTSDMLQVYKDEMKKLEDQLREQTINDPTVALQNMYSSILRGSANNTGVLGEKIHDELKKQGYDGVPDLNDTGPSYAETPTYIFDRESVLTDKKLIDPIKDIVDDYKMKYID